MAANEKLYFLLRKAVEVFTRVNNRLEIHGEENIPETGGALICPNHANFSDPFFVGAAVKKRVLHFLAWHGIEEMPLVGPVFKELGTMHSIKESYGVSLDKEEAKMVLGELEELLKSGELCVIFPEGAINHWIRPPGDELKEFKSGALRLAARAGTPIIPVGMTGTRWVVPNIINYHEFGGPDDGIWIPMALPVKVRINIGEKFYVDPEAATDAATAKMEAEKLKERIRILIKTIQ